MSCAYLFGQCAIGSGMQQVVGLTGLFFLPGAPQPPYQPGFTPRPSVPPYVNPFRPRPIVPPDLPGGGSSIVFDAARKVIVE